MQSFSQAGQDIFILKCLENKKYGTFVEIGSHDPIYINNTYLLEKDYEWRGLLIEHDLKYEEQYKKIRPNSIPIMKDATTINWDYEFKNANLPLNIDYLQIDLEVDDLSTLKTLIHLNNQVMNTYKFAVVTFEHDIYRGNFFNTQSLSRSIFEERGYFPVFKNISNESNAFEDWYVHPDLIDITKLKTIACENIDFKDAINKLTNLYV